MRVLITFDDRAFYGYMYLQWKINYGFAEEQMPKKKMMLFSAWTAAFTEIQWWKCRNFEGSTLRHNTDLLPLRFLFACYHIIENDGREKEISRKPGKEERGLHGGKMSILTISLPS